MGLGMKRIHRKGQAVHYLMTDRDRLTLVRQGTDTIFALMHGQDHSWSYDRNKRIEETLHFMRLLATRQEVAGYKISELESRFCSNRRRYWQSRFYDFDEETGITSPADPNDERVCREVIRECQEWKDGTFKSLQERVF